MFRRWLTGAEKSRAKRNSGLLAGPAECGKNLIQAPDA